tara:strand:- start:88 stop:345 length:258 start_codon:yes stop_codon:yes gene_type:complete
MDKWTKQDNGKAFKRATDIEVSSKFKEQVEKAAIMHLHAGHMNEYMIAMNTLQKIDTVNALQEQADRTADKVDKLINSLGGTAEE